MERTLFERLIQQNAKVIEEIRNSAYSLHEHVGQTYDKTLPYSFHLSMVADAVLKYGHKIIINESDILPVIFAAYYHDSIEDARLTYNDIKDVARKYMSPEQSYMAAEIVYALTNDKGRTRQERAGENYYAGIRQTPYAPFVKLCDRLANLTYSINSSNNGNFHMLEVYKSEWPHFIQSITVSNDDTRYNLPKVILDEINDIIQ